MNRRYVKGKMLHFIMPFLLCIFLFSTHVIAVSNNTYKISELGLKIDIPSEYVVFTRNISDDDPNLVVYGLSKSDLTEIMSTRNIYLNAWDEDVNNEIIVTMVDSPLSDFGVTSDTLLTALASTFESSYKNAGLTISNYEIYQHSQTKFIKIYISQKNGNNTVYGLQYYTVYDGKAINITLQSYSGKIDSSKEKILRSIVDTVKFDKQTASGSASKETEAFVYKDTRTGCEFTVPRNWSQGEFLKDQDYFDTKFISNKESGLSILYGSEDIWEQMTESEKKGYKRTDVNNSMFTKREFADLLGVLRNDEVETVIYAGDEYYKAEIKKKQEIYGLELLLTITQLIRIDNGYIYTFQFSGDSNNSYYKDFESLLKSVKYAKEDNETRSLIRGHSDSSDSYALTEENEPWNYSTQIISLIVTIAIYSLPILVYRFLILRHSVDKKKAMFITIIYGGISLLIMFMLILSLKLLGVEEAAFSVSALVFWSCVNYYILKDGGIKQGANPKSARNTHMVAKQYPFVEADHGNKGNFIDASKSFEQKQKEDFSVTMGCKNVTDVIGMPVCMPEEMISNINVKHITEDLEKENKTIISYAILVGFLVDLRYAEKRVSKEAFKDIHKIYDDLQSRNTLIEVDYDNFMKIFNEVIRAFNAVMPIELYGQQKTIELLKHFQISDKKQKPIPEESKELYEQKEAIETINKTVMLDKQLETNSEADRELQRGHAGIQNDVKFMQSKQNEGKIDDEIKLIEKLSELYNKGILTEEEFNQKKAEILARI